MKIWTNSACPHSYFILWRFHLHLRELHIRIDRVCAYDDCRVFMRNPFKMRISLSIPLACCSRSFVSFWWMKNERCVAFEPIDGDLSLGESCLRRANSWHLFTLFMAVADSSEWQLRAASQSTSERKFHSQFTKEMCHSISDELSRIFSIDD